LSEVATGGATAAGWLAIVCNSRGRSFSLLTLTADGAIRRQEAMAFPEVDGHSWACPMAVTPDWRFLYLGFRGNPAELLSFEIDRINARLIYLGKMLLPENLAYLSTDRTGRFLFGASYAAGAVSISPIPPDGRVVTTEDVIRTGPKAHCVLPSPDNRMVFATNMADDAIRRFRFDAVSGALALDDAPAVSVKRGTGPRHFAFHPRGRFVYAINEYVATVTAFSFDSDDGTMRELENYPLLPPDFDGEPAATDIHLTPDGRFLYAAERESSTLSSFAVEPGSGRLHFLAREKTALSPRGFAIDPAGRFLTVLGQTKDQFFLYALDSETGALRLLQERTVGGGPNWVEIVPLVPA
jgi:6-phosphogluconolactonase